MRLSTKLFAATTALAMGFAANASAAAELYNNGPVVVGGVSLLTAPATTYGFGTQAASGNTVADNFSVATGGWNVTSLDFFSYQTGAVGFTFTNATWSIISGTNIATGTVVASGTTTVTNGGLVGYRAQSTTPTDQSRAIYRLNADIVDLTLASGNYFLTWSLNGTGASGPWTPPVIGVSGNALQSTAGGPFATLVDVGSGLGAELPFVINGTANVGAVPEPATWAMMIGGFGAIGGSLRARRRKVSVSFA